MKIEWLLYLVFLVIVFVCIYRSMKNAPEMDEDEE